LAKLLGIKETRAVPIKSFEGCVGLKISDGSKNLAHFFNRQFLFGNEEEQLFEFKF